MSGPGPLTEPAEAEQGRQDPHRGYGQAEQGGAGYEESQASAQGQGGCDPAGTGLYGRMLRSGVLRVCRQWSGGTEAPLLVGTLTAQAGG